MCLAPREKDRRRTGKSLRARNETRRIAAHTYVSATTRRLRPPVGQVKTEFSNYTDWQAPCCWVSGLFAARPCRLTPVTRRALVLNGTAIGTTNTAAEVMNKITPADISDPQEVIARGEALSFELGTPITPAFEALVFKASRMESQHGKDLGEIIKAAHSASGLTKQLLATPNNPPRIRRKSIPAARSSRSPSWPRSSFVRCGKHWIDEARCPSPRPDRSPRRCHLVRDRIS